MEIAEAMKLPTTPESRKEDLMRLIQGHLESNEAELSTDPRFKGLYSRRSKCVSS